jgi:hypothetical protein
LDFKSIYQDLLTGTDNADLNEIIGYLCNELTYVWIEDYKNNCTHFVDVCRISIGSFEYLFDDCVVSKDNVMINSKIESRLVAAFGTSIQSGKKRDDYRLRGWLGPTNTFLGTLWDKGHYIAHSIGGAVDLAELNVFKQRRDLNRGWSDEGKLFRKMEGYCFDNPGTFCFHRPIYIDDSMCPGILEYGVLTKEKQFWIARFNNRI